MAADMAVDMVNKVDITITDAMVVVMVDMDMDTDVDADAVAAAEVTMDNKINGTKSYTTTTVRLVTLVASAKIKVAVYM